MLPLPVWLPLPQAVMLIDAFGSIVIGAVAGVLVVFGVWFLDYKLHVDDPVGAVAVHCLNGIWGTVAVGFFATPSAPAFARGFGDGVSFGANQIAGAGLFYGGGFKQLGLQLLGMFATIAWTAVTITITFIIIKKIFGLRVSEEEEIIGLDAKEHGLPSAYAGFSIMDISNTMTMDVNENTDLGCFGLRQGFRVPEGCSCQGCGSSDHRFCKRHLQGCHHCKAVSLRSTEDCIKRPWCNRYDQ